ncbi:DegV family protein [Actinocatenispora sera]|jgi:DegV family protein with EDD domain|nr:DegV family protein [Actinocatenispora sera]
MSQRLAIVTDSTASLPAQLAARLGIRVVPLQVKIGDRITNEDQLDRAELFAALRADVPVATAEPSSSAFFWAYQEAADAGATAIISIHISGRLSQTCAAAQSAADRCGVPVRVVDSQTTGMSLGFAVLAAARAAAAGRAPGDVLALAAAQRGHINQLVYVDTLEYLRRGGRIGPAAAFLGTALSIKPLLGVDGGQIVPVTRVRGTRRALSQLVDLAGRGVDGDRLQAAVEHIDAPDRAADTARLLAKRFPALPEPIVTPSSATLAVHLGPGAVGLALSPG